MILYGIQHLYPCYFSGIVAASAPIYAFQEILSAVPLKPFFLSHLLLFNLTIVEKMISSGRQMNLVTMSVIKAEAELAHSPVLCTDNCTTDKSHICDQQKVLLQLL